MHDAPLSPLHRQVWTAALAALIAAGAYLHIPIGPVPISLQTYFVLLAGFILGPVRGGVCVLLYLAAGAIGLPVFAGGKGGLGVFLGPTGGYLAGFVCCAVVCGLGKPRDAAPGVVRTLLIGLAGFAVLYACGLAWLMHAINASFAKAVSVGLVPFLPGLAIKAVAAALTLRALARQRLLPA
ncbi:MAG: biotin transporter BioY [Desulfovibrionaceae bacterium]